MDERVKLGFEFAKEIGTQLITLSTGLLALSVTFTKELADRRTSKTWLFVAWGLHVASIMCGVWTLMALTGALISSTGDNIPGFGVPVRLPAFLQVSMFVLGIGAMVAYGIQAFRSAKPDAEASRTASATFE